MEGIGHPGDSLDAPIRLRDFTRLGKFAQVPWWGRLTAVSIFSLLGLLAVFAIAAVLIVLLEDAPPWIPLAIVSAWGLILIVSYVHWLLGAAHRTRLARFALLNGLEYRDHVITRGRPGLGFPLRAKNVERGMIRNEWLDIGTNYPTNSERNDRGNITRPFVFAEIILPRDLPHMILKNPKSRILSLAGMGLGNRVKLDLEGDFHRHFTLYCPAGYERDALYIFTPDVMAAVLDVAQNAEVEVIEDRLYLYMRHTTRIWRAEVMNALLGSIALLNERFARQASVYRDDDSGQGDGGVSFGLAGHRMTGNSGVSATGILASTAVISVSVLIALFTFVIAPMLGG